MTLPSLMGSRAMRRTYSPIRSFRPKREHIDRRRCLLISAAHMAIRPILKLPDPTLRKKAKPDRARGRRFAPSHGRHALDHVRRAGHRACRAADRHPQAADRHGPGQGRSAEDARDHGQPGDPRAVRGAAPARGGLPLHPRLHRRGRTARQDACRLYRPRGQKAARWSSRASGQPWSSTRSTI